MTKQNDKVIVYTIDELWESGEWDHGHEFVEHSAYLKLQEELAEARMVIEFYAINGITAREFLIKYPKKEG